MAESDLPPFELESLPKDRPPILDLRLQTYGDEVESAVSPSSWQKIISSVVTYNKGIVSNFNITLGGAQAIRGRLTADLAEYCALIPNVRLAVEVASPLGTIALRRLHDLQARLPTMRVVRPQTPVASTVFRLHVDPEGVAFWRLPGESDEMQYAILGDCVQGFKRVMSCYEGMCANMVLTEMIASSIASPPDNRLRSMLLGAVAAQRYDARTTPKNVYGYDRSRVPRIERRPAVRSPKRLFVDLTTRDNQMDHAEMNDILSAMRSAGLEAVRLNVSDIDSSLYESVAQSCRRYNIVLNLVANRPDLPPDLMQTAHAVIAPVSVGYDMVPRKLQPYTFNILDADTIARLQHLVARLEHCRIGAFLLLQLPVRARDAIRLQRLPQALEIAGLPLSQIALELLEPYPLKLVEARQDEGEGFYSRTLINTGDILRASFREVQIRHWANEPGYQAVMDAAGNMSGYEAMLSAPLVPIYYGNLREENPQAVFTRHEAHLVRIRNRRTRIEDIRLPLGVKASDLIFGGGTYDIENCKRRLRSEDALAEVFFATTPTAY